MAPALRRQRGSVPPEGPPRPSGSTLSPVPEIPLLSLPRPPPATSPFALRPPPSTSPPPASPHPSAATPSPGRTPGPGHRRQRSSPATPSQPASKRRAGPLLSPVHLTPSAPSPGRLPPSLSPTVPPSFSDAFALAFPDDFRARLATVPETERRAFFRHHADFCASFWSARLPDPPLPPLQPDPQGFVPESLALPLASQASHAYHAPSSTPGRSFISPSFLVLWVRPSSAPFVSDISMRLFSACFLVISVCGCLSALFHRDAGGQLHLLSSLVYLQSVLSCTMLIQFFI